MKCSFTFKQLSQQLLEKYMQMIVAYLTLKRHIGCDKVATSRRIGTDVTCQ